MPQIEVEDFTFKRSRTRTYDATNDPNAAISAIMQLLCPVGTLVPTMAQTEPGEGWRICNGQPLFKEDFPRLFAVIGPAFGETATTFNLPDLRGRMPIGAGTGLGFLTQGGADSVTLSVDQLPQHAHAVNDPGHNHTFTPTPHTHTIIDPGHAHAITDPGHLHTAGTRLAQTAAAGADQYEAGTGNTGSATTGITVNSATTGVTAGETSAGGTINSRTTGISVLPTGAGQEIPTLPPYLAVNWMVRT